MEAIIERGAEENKGQETENTGEERVLGGFVISQIYNWHLPFIKIHVLRDIALHFLLHAVLNPRWPLIFGNKSYNFSK